MYRFWACILLAAALFAGDPLYELSGHLATPQPAAVTLFGADSPFRTEAETSESGQFRIRNLRAGAYTVAVYVPGKGEARKTIEIGPGTADGHRRVALNLEFKDSDYELNEAIVRRNTVSAKELTIPDAAFHDYQEAAKDLQKHDTAAAMKRLEHAVELAPQYADAWNDLGTIAYQTQQYDRAEQCFRHALDEAPGAYAPLVNLGGVLINTNKLAEALMYNQDAVLIRPNDALANSQLGLTYFAVNNFDLAIKYLEIARRIDPSHFSHPQLVLAEIHLRRGENKEAADMLEDFLAHHPDYPLAAKFRENIAKLRQ